MRFLKWIQSSIHFQSLYYLLYSCRDIVMRVIDIKLMTRDYSISFDSMNRIFNIFTLLIRQSLIQYLCFLTFISQSFIGFSADGTKITNTFILEFIYLCIVARLEDVIPRRFFPLGLNIHQIYLRYSHIYIALNIENII